MQIIIKTLTGNTIPLNVEEDFSVKYITKIRQIKFAL